VTGRPPPKTATTPPPTATKPRSIANRQQSSTSTSRLPTPPHPIRAELRAASLPSCGTPPCRSVRLRTPA
jgi:hypothetical protein